MGTSNLANLIYRDGLLSLKLIRMIERDSGNCSAAFAKMLVAMGLFTETSLVQYISKRAEFPVVHGSLITPAMAALNALDLPIMEELEVIPISIEGKRIKVAMADPLDQNVLLQLRFFSDLRVSPVVAMFSTIERSFYKFRPGFKLSHAPMEKILAAKIAEAYQSALRRQASGEDGDIDADDDAEYMRKLLKEEDIGFDPDAAPIGKSPEDMMHDINPNAELNGNKLTEELDPNMSQEELLRRAALKQEVHSSPEPEPEPPAESPEDDSDTHDVNETDTSSPDEPDNEDASLLVDKVETGSLLADSTLVAADDPSHIVEVEEASTIVDESGISSILAEANASLPQDSGTDQTADNAVEELEAVEDVEAMDAVDDGAEMPEASAPQEMSRESDSQDAIEDEDFEDPGERAEASLESSMPTESEDLVEAMVETPTKPVRPPQREFTPLPSFTIDPSIGFLNHAIAMTSLSLSAMEALPLMEHAMLHAGFSKGGIYKFTDKGPTLLYQWGEDKTMKPLPYSPPEELNAFANTPASHHWHPFPTENQEWDIYRVEKCGLFTAVVPAKNASCVVVCSVKKDKLTGKALNDLSLRLVSEFLKK